MNTGSSELHFTISWEGVEVANAAEATRGRIAAYIGDRQVWGRNGEGFVWTSIELLEHLSETWTYLEWEEIDPLGLGERPEYLRLSANKRWEEDPVENPDAEQEALWEFERCHNLARAFQGAWPADLWVLRQGNAFVTAGAGIRSVQPAEQVLVTLERLGDDIAERIRSLSDQRSKMAIDKWTNRRKVSSKRFVASATSMDHSALIEIVGKEEFGEFWELSSNLQSNELLAAARMVGNTLPAGHIRKVLNRVRTIGRSNTLELDRLAALVDCLDPSVPVWQQGYSLAVWLRGKLGCVEGPIDPLDLLKQWKVFTASESWPTSEVDAVSCWGPAHGPAVIINNNGRHAQTTAGRRSTYAHEIGHLLADRRQFLPLAEVLGGRTPRFVESRAGAFGAELIVPRRVVGRLLAESDDPRRDVEKLRRRYGASREIVAWQARNSEIPMQPKVLAYLRSLVTRPLAY